MPFAIAYNFLSKLKKRHFFIIDLIVGLLSPLLALYIRLDGSIDFNRYGHGLILITAFFLIAKLFVYLKSGLYNRFWRTASIDEMTRILFMGIFVIIIQAIIDAGAKALHIPGITSLPHSIDVLDGVVSTILIGSYRFSIRMLERANQKDKISAGGERVLIIGAGYAGVAIVEEMQRNPHLGLIPVAFADDDKAKKNNTIRGIIVAGDTYNIAAITDMYRINKIIIAMPSAPGAKIRQIVTDCNKLNLETLTVPGIFEILGGRIDLEKLRKIQVDDLLRRAPIKIDAKSVEMKTRDKRILVTGAGGSIGSEICRQVMKYDPEWLILLGHGENSIFEIEQELSYIKKLNTSSQTVIKSYIGDIRDRERIEEIFAEAKPDIIYHAAAHKHVPLMELNPKEAITNNIAGTKNLIDKAVEYNVEDFIMISSDKAVNPANIMGTTKRIAEMIVLQGARKYNKRFSAVRFGNVLGSRGSVLHTFKRQIEQGGPVTVTDPEIRRFFMTIPEAVQLVLQASVLGEGGDVFILDMGNPIKLVDLAKDFIRLSGFKEFNDIKIEFTGLRPGEKLFEELFIKGEIYEKTKHEKVLIAKNASNVINPNLEARIFDLIFNISVLNNDQVYSKLRNIVPEFKPVFSTSGDISAADESGLSFAYSEPHTI